MPHVAKYAINDDGSKVFISGNELGLYILCDLFFAMYMYILG